tara:strand:- start:2046 stop:2672 length:627 start_codon:yes stop_codon:yes gene_type:complete
MRRVLVAIPLAVVMAGLVLLLMASLVTPAINEGRSTHVLRAVDFVVMEQEQTHVRRSRFLPEPPDTPKAPSAALPKSSTVDASLESSSEAFLMAVSEVNVSIGPLSVSTVSLGEVPFSYQATPVYRVDPNYPAKAKQRRAQGYVIVRFNIDEQGIPRDLEVIEAKPKRLFEREALKALKQWRYQARIEQGVAVSHMGQTVKLEFKYPK